MLNAIQQGIFTASTKQRLEELEKQKEELSLSMTTAELQKPKLTREYMEHWFSQLRHGDPHDREFQKRLIDTFVNTVFVYDDKLVLTYNYQHGTQAITYKEVEDFLGSDLVAVCPPKIGKLRQKVADFYFIIIHSSLKNDSRFLKESVRVKREEVWRLLRRQIKIHLRVGMSLQRVQALRPSHQSRNILSSRFQMARSRILCEGSAAFSNAAAPPSAQL